MRRSRNVTPDNSMNFIQQNISRASSSVSNEGKGVNIKLLEPMSLKTKDKVHATKAAKQASKAQIHAPSMTIEIPKSKQETPRSELLIQDQTYSVEESNDNLNDEII